MADSNESELPDELEPVAAMLRASRAAPDPLELDRLKRRAMALYTSRRGRRPHMRSRIATVLTVMGLAAGTGGALAVASTGGGAHKSAATSQYCQPPSHLNPHGKCVPVRHKK